MDGDQLGIAMDGDQLGIAMDGDQLEDDEREQSDPEVTYHFAMGDESESTGEGNMSGSLVSESDKLSPDELSVGGQQDPYNFLQRRAEIQTLLYDKERQKEQESAVRYHPVSSAWRDLEATLSEERKREQEKRKVDSTSGFPTPLDFGGDSE